MSFDSMFFRPWKYDIVFSLSCGSDFIFRSFDVITYNVEQHILKEKEKKIITKYYSKVDNP